MTTRPLRERTSASADIDYRMEGTAPTIGPSEKSLIQSEVIRAEELMTLAHLNSRVGRLEDGQARLESGQKEIRGLLTQLAPQIAAINESLKFVIGKDVFEREIAARPTRSQLRVDIGWMVALIAGIVTLTRCSLGG